MPNIGPMEIAIVLVLLLVVFGPKKLPDLGRSMGKGLREFRSSVTSLDGEPGSAEVEGGDKPTAEGQAPEKGHRVS